MAAAEPASSANLQPASATSADKTAALAVTAVVLVAWAAILLLILSNPIFVTNDSLNNYAHVWFISDRFWSDLAPPLRMDVLYSGQAYVCPYSCLPWFAAALVRPVLGDWTV